MMISGLTVLSPPDFVRTIGDERHGLLLVSRCCRGKAQCDINLSSSPHLEHYPQANAEASSLTLCPRSGTSEAPDSPPLAPPTAESAHNAPDALPGRWGISSARHPPMDQPPWPPLSAPVGCQTRTAAAETTAARHQPATAVAPRTPRRDSSPIRLAARRAGYTP